MPVMYADMAVHSPKGRFAGAVELKNWRNLTAEQATEYRRSLIDHDSLPESDYLLVVSQERAYLWRNQRDAGPETQPDAEFSTSDVIARYVPESLRSTWLSDASLQPVVMGWLGDLTFRNEPATHESDKALEKAGFVAAIHEGTWTWETL